MSKNKDKGIMTKRPRLFIILTSFLVFAPFFLWPQFLTSRDNDLGRTYIPLFTFFHESVLIHKEIPLWRGDQFMGEPFIANPVSSLFYPGNILFLLLSAKLASIVYLQTHFALAAIFTFYLAKSFRLSNISSLAAAIFYAFSTKFLVHLSAGHITMIAAFIYLPLAFLALRKILISPNIFWITIMSLSLSLSYIAYPTIAYYTLIFLILYWIYYNLMNLEKINIFSRTYFKERILPLILVLVILTGLSSIVLFPQLEFAPLSTRPQLTLEDVALPLWNLKRFVSSLVFPYINFDGFDHESFLYLGFIPLLLSILGFFKLPNIKKIVLVLIFIFTLMFVAGLSTPLFKLAYNLLPLLNYLRITTRLWFVVVLVVALLAAYALENIKNRYLIYFVILLFLVESIFIGYKKISAIPYLSFDNLALYQYLSKDKEFFRVYCTTYCFNPQLISEYKIEVLHGESPIQYAPFIDFLSKAGNYYYSKFAVIFPPYQVWQKENPPQPNAQTLGLANVKYVASTYPLTNQEFTLMGKFEDVYLYRNEKVIPRAYFEDSSDKVEILMYRPNSLTLKFQKAPSPRKLVISENFYSHWYSYSDNRKYEVVRFPPIFRSIDIEPEAQQVELRYQPASFLFGKTITISTVFVLLLYFWYIRKKRLDG